MSPTLLAPETSNQPSTRTSTRPVSAPITPESVEHARQLAAEVARKVKQDLRMGREHQDGRINWITAIVMGLFHVGAIAALFCFSWTHLAVACVLAPIHTFFATGKCPSPGCTVTPEDV